jgi:cell wall assembly regulator SMI1
MPVSLPSSARTQRSTEEIAVVERALGVLFPEAYRRFLGHHDGVTPPPNVFSVGADNDSGVRRFVPLVELTATHRALADRLPAGALPVAADDCGNYICLDTAGGGAVIFWDHETEHVLPVAADFAAFLEQLAPFDPASVTLDPADVISVWVDPALLAELQAKDRDAAG